MDDWKKSYTEEELDFLDCKREMEMLPWQRIQYDYKLSKYIYGMIKHQLRKNFPRTAAYTSNDLLCEFSKELASKIEDYQIAVMPYESLAQVVAEQSYSVRLIAGNVRKDELFALLDEKARVVGVHVPKSKKLRALEHKVEKAMDQLDSFIERKGGRPNAFIRASIEKFVFEQKHADHVPEIKIIAVKTPIKGGTEVNVRGFGGLQMSFKAYEEKEVVYYHII